MCRDAAGFPFFPLASLGQGAGPRLVLDPPEVGPSASAENPHSWLGPARAQGSVESGTLHHALLDGRPGFSWRWRALANSARCGRVYD